MKLTSIAVLAAALCSCVHVNAQTAQFPGAIATDANLKVAVNGVTTLLTQTISSGTTTFSISACAGIVANVLITIDSEIMSTTGCSGTTWVGVRGFDGTVAASHSSQAIIYAYVDAWHHNSLKAEVEAIETALGVNLANVSGVTTFNTRSGAVTLIAADITAAAQDVRTSASPTFAAVTAASGGTVSTNTGGYAYIANQANAGGYYYTGNGNILGGITTGHTVGAFTTADGSCTLRADTGLACTGTQAVLTSSSPTFAGIKVTPGVFSSLPSCAAGTEGTSMSVTDSTTVTWGATITGGSTSHVLAYCNGTNWTVAAK